MIERRIKELSIALEALSRVNGYGATNHSIAVSDLLERTIKEAKEPKPEPIFTQSRDDDDIPF